MQEREGGGAIMVAGLLLIEVVHGEARRQRSTRKVQTVAARMGRY